MTGYGGTLRARLSGRPLGALPCFAAAVLALVGSFQPLISIAQEFPFAEQVERLEFTVTSWAMRTNPPGPFVSGDTTTLNGVPLTVAALALLAAAVLGLRTAPWAANTKITRATGPTAGLGAAFLAGTVGTIGMQVGGWVRGSESGNSPFPIEASIGAGFWMLVAAAALAIAGALLARRPAVPVEPREEPDTPVLGIPVVIRLPGEPPPNG